MGKGWPKVKRSSEKNMIDWNNNDTIDPEEIILTEVILSEEEEPEQPPKHSGCFLTLLALPFLFIMKGFHL